MHSGLAPREGAKQKSIPAPSRVKLSSLGKIFIPFHAIPGAISTQIRSSSHGNPHIPRKIAREPRFPEVGRVIASIEVSNSTSVTKC